MRIMSLASEDKKRFFHPALSCFRYGLFTAFFLLSLRFAAVYLFHLPPVILIAGMCCVLTLGFFSWIRLRWVLIGFLAGVPFVSGLQTTGLIIPAPLLSFSFAVIYSTWFLRRVVWNRDTLEPRSVIGNMADILSALVMISLVMSFQPYPADFVLRRIWTLPTLAQKDVFWCIDASYIFLQGLFLYRILEIELNGKTMHGTVVSIMYAQTAVIILFSLLHLFFNIPDNFHYGNFGIFSPFDDAHSYGSYLAFLFFVFLSLAITGNGRRRMISAIFSCFIASFIMFSGSRVTWITLVLVGICLLLYVLGKRGRIVLISSVAVPLLLINLFPGPLERADNGYLKRLSTVVLFKGYFKRELNMNLSGRLLWWSRAKNILAEEPATGIGIGSFYRVSPLYTPRESEKSSHVQENAHNYYIQVATEVGIPALLIFLGLMFFTFKAGLRALVQCNVKAKGLISGLLLGLAAYLITMLTSHPLLLSNQQFLFWSIISFVIISYHASGGGRLWKAPAPYTHLLLGLLAFATLVGYARRIAEGEDHPGISEYGHYEYDREIGSKMRWTAKTSGVRVYGESPVIGLSAYAAPDNIGPEGLKLSIFVDDQLLDCVSFVESGKKFLYYYVPSIEGRNAVIKTQVDHTFNPYRLGLTGDLKKNRVQGVAVSPVTFLRIMPTDGLGFYDWQTFEGDEVPYGLQKAAHRFRWTGMQASMNLQKEFRDGGSLFLMCSHPHIERDPVDVEIMHDGELLRRETFADHKWKTVVIEPQEIKVAEVLTLRVSRTWNPRLEGVSHDGRDLGVAVAYKEGMPGP